MDLRERSYFEAAMLLHLVIILMAMVLSWAAAGQARAQSPPENQDRDRATRRLDGVVRQALPLPAVTLPRETSRYPALWFQPQMGFETVCPSPSVKLLDLVPNLKGLASLVSPGRLLLAGVAGLNIKRGMLTAYCPLPRGISAYASIQPVNSWKAPWYQEPTGKPLSVGVYLPISRGSAKTGDNLSLRISTGIDPGFRPAVFITLTTQGLSP